MEWVAIDVHIGGNAVTHRLAEAFKLRVAEAAGLLTLTFAGMAQHAADGSLADVPNSQIESWAQWHGKRGKYAEFFRAQLCDADGVVREWEDYNGASMRAAESSRERSRRWRDVRRREREERELEALRLAEQTSLRTPVQPANGTAERTAFATHTERVANASTGPDLTGHDSPSDLLPPPRDGEEARLAERAPEAWPVAARFLAGKDETARMAWIGRFHGALDRPPHPTGQELADALEDLMTKPREDWVPTLFRQYVTRIRRDASKDAERAATPVMRSFGRSSASAAQFAAAAAEWDLIKNHNLLTPWPLAELTAIGDTLVSAGSFASLDAFMAWYRIIKPTELREARTDRWAVEQIVERHAALQQRAAS